MCGYTDRAGIFGIYINLGVCSMLKETQNVLSHVLEAEISGGSGSTWGFSGAMAGGCV